MQKNCPLPIATSRATSTLAPDGTPTDNYEGLIAPLVKAVQEQHTEIEALKATMPPSSATLTKSGALSAQAGNATHFNTLDTNACAESH